MIKNKSTQKIISNQEIICKNIFSQARGLMFRSKKNLIMNFKNERIISLHNFFVFFPLEVLVLNQDKKVIEIKTCFKPFTFWQAKNKGKYLIELALEKSKNKVKVGDQLEF